MVYIGIDISKSSFVAAYPSATDYRVRTYPNTTAGVRKFIATLSAAEHHCVMEATGNYSFLLLYLLHQSGIAVSLVNPKKIKYFAKMMMEVTKTDEKDARMIAMYAEKMNPPIYKMPADTLLLLKQKKTVIRQLRKQLVASQNLRESLSVLPYQDKVSLRTLEKTIAFMTKQIDFLESELADIASDVFDRQFKALISIKGIGVTLASALILSTGGFSYFENAKQLSRFIGICPTYQQSGTSVKVKGHINKNGDKSLRSLLYIASWSALQYNATCRDCYLRLKAKGKPSKVALIAVANKLVRQAFAIATTDAKYIDGFVSTKK